MRRLAMVVLALTALSGAASAQSPQDCESPYAFPLRRFQHSVVTSAAGGITRDPYNTVLVENLARCDAGPMQIYVCGTFARRNRAGYVDGARRFFGLFKGLDFTFVAFDREADRFCRAKRIP